MAEVEPGPSENSGSHTPTSAASYSQTILATNPVSTGEAEQRCEGCSAGGTKGKRTVKHGAWCSASSQALLSLSYLFFFLQDLMRQKLRLESNFLRSYKKKLQQQLRQVRAAWTPSMGHLSDISL